MMKRIADSTLTLRALTSDPRFLIFLDLWKNKDMCSLHLMPNNSEDW